MIVPDVNLLLYAHLTPFPEHAAARRWWEQAAGSEREIGLAPVVIFGFVRIATNRRVFERPLTISDATARVEEWLDLPTARLLTPGPDHFAIAFRLLRRLGTAADLTTDAQIAAFALENQAEVVSNDADFGRFPGLRWSNPLAPRRQR
ncbi:MAG TPA: type II toxin-antitoxin system VapC family toxin [Polyangiaceae bacterium]|nr:type II toxin-antitoxin system VapC family toxin [Polyangiaceae bacterium]